MQPLVSFKSHWKPISFRCRKSRLRRDSCLYPDIVIMISHKIRVRWRTSYCQGQSVFVVGVKYYSDKKHWDIWQVKSLDRFIYLKYILSNRRHKIAHLRSSKTEISPHSYFVSFDNCVFMVWLSLGTKVTWLVWGKDRVWIQIQLKKCPVVSPLQKVKLHPVQSFLWYENLHMYRFGLQECKIPTLCSSALADVQPRGKRGSDDVETAAEEMFNVYDRYSWRRGQERYANIHRLFLHSERNLWPFICRPEAQNKNKNSVFTL